MRQDRYIVNIGLGPWQTPLVEAAQAMGYRVIGVDINPEAPGVACVDIFLCMSAHDPAPIRTAIAALELGGAETAAVITIGSRGSLTCAGILARDLGVRGRVFDLDGLDTLVDREKFRRLLRNQGLAIPAYQVVTHSDAHVDMPPPLIVKSVLDTSGSEGLTVVRARELLPEAIRHAQNVTGLGAESRVIVEQYIEGRDIGVLGFFSDGALCWQAFVDREVEPMPHCLPKHYSAPAVLSDAETSVLNDSHGRLAQAIGITSGPFYTEFRLVAEGPVCYALEAEPTLPAYAARLVGEAYGIDPYRQFIETVVEGKALHPLLEPGAAACCFVYSRSPGRIWRIEQPTAIPDGAEVRMLRKAGQSVDNNSARAICAVAFARAKDLASANKGVRNLAEQVVIEMAAVKSSRTPRVSAQQ